MREVLNDLTQMSRVVPDHPIASNGSVVTSLQNFGEVTPPTRRHDRLTDIAGRVVSGVVG